jgi:hypothetical protein
MKKDATVGTEKMVKCSDLTARAEGAMAAETPSLRFPLPMSIAMHSLHFQNLFSEDQHFQGHGSLQHYLFQLLVVAQQKGTLPVVSV